MSKLNDIAVHHGTDKSSEFHNYCEKYEKYFPFDTGSKLSILEIGVLKGESLRMWKDYFSQASIVGIDINPDCKQSEEDRISIETGSQADDVFLAGVVKKHGPFDLIIDDGSHINSHVIFSFEHLFQSVKPKGVYVVEDASTSYWANYNGGLNKKKSTIEYFKNLIDDVNFRGVLNTISPRKYARREDHLRESFKIGQTNCRMDIESINFLNGLIIVTKR